MPRKGPAPKRPVMVDPVYGSPLVSQLVSKILLDGKKTVAQNIVYTALEGCRAPGHSQSTGGCWASSQYRCPVPGFVKKAN